MKKYNLTPLNNAIELKNNNTKKIEELKFYNKLIEKEIVEEIWNVLNNNILNPIVVRDFFEEKNVKDFVNIFKIIYNLEIENVDFYSKYISEEWYNIRFKCKNINFHLSMPYHINLAHDYSKIQIGTYDDLTTTIKCQSYFMEDIVEYIKKEAK
jgi:hypothetical protein